MLLPDELTQLAIFPLPAAVLFPGAVLQLHVFEPRYRSMIEDALAATSLIALACIEPGHESSHLAKPPVLSVAGVGRIVRHAKLPSGRYNIMLEGVARVRIEEEIVSESAYRMVRASQVVDLEADAKLVSLHLATLRHCFMSLHVVHPGLAAALTTVLVNMDDPATISNILASVLFAGADKRQRLLEELDIAARLDASVVRVSELLAEASTGGDPDAFN